MFIKIGEKTFDADKLTSVQHTAGPPETTTVFLGGDSIVFTDDDAASVWNWHLSRILIEL